MGVLDYFEVIENVQGFPTVSITRNGISFNKTVIEKLGKPKNVKVMIDKENKRIAIVPCGQYDKGARPFYREGRDTSNGVRWNNYDLRNTVEKMMSWRLKDDGKKAKGEYFEEDNAIIFDLNITETISR